jgi:myo-inositol catabolism protein IolC
MKPGHTDPLYLLPFDHRHSYLSGMFGFSGPLTDSQHAAVVDSKRLIYEGFVLALDRGVPAAHSGILVDEEFGTDILRDAARRGAITALSVESSGSDEFQFEYGDDFAAHIESFDPTFAKVLVRFNPQGDAALNQRQVKRLATLSAWCREHEQRLMFELLLPATPEQLARAGGSAADYDRQQRPALMLEAIAALQDAGIEPDVWKVEGLARREDCARLVAMARRDGRTDIGCIVLGRGADDTQVASWLATAASVPGFIGFAVGRTSFWDAVAAFEKGSATRADAAGRIADRFREWVGIFERAKAGAPDALPSTTGTPR